MKSSQYEMEDNAQQRVHALQALGWNEDREASWGHSPLFSGSGFEPGRITADYGSRYRLSGACGETAAVLSGKLRHSMETSPEGPPAIGDWVAYRPAGNGDPAVIHELLPRRSFIARKAAGSTVMRQAVAANVDTLFVVCALNDDFNVRRVERYLIMAWNSGAVPVVLLTKADLCPEAEELQLQMEAAAPGVAVHRVSALMDEGMEALQPYLAFGKTVALTGSSGCGKSTLVNRLSGEEVQRTGEVRGEDGRGRHTTTHRELFRLPGGAIVIDTPGMRELQLWEDDGGLDLAFGDIAKLGEDCRFADCRHEREEGCAVLAAVRSGELEEKRLINYRKTEKELEYQSRKESKARRKETASAARSAKKPRMKFRYEGEE